LFRSRRKCFLRLATNCGGCRMQLDIMCRCLRRFLKSVEHRDSKLDLGIKA
jgi:hypothetical protein